MHLFNRFYILFALALGLLLPTQDFYQSNPALRMQPDETLAGIKAQIFVDIKRAPVMLFTDSVFPAVGTEGPAITEATAANSSIPESNDSFPLALALFSIYLAITTLMLIKYGYGLFQIISKARNSEQVPVDGTPSKLVLLDEEVSPHSFMDYIFVSREEYEKGQINKDIIAHERAHIQGYHSLDLLFVEFIKSLCWWNPGVYLFRRALQINHEFWADEQVITKTNDIESYQKQLLEVAVTNKQILLASNLNFFLTKQRMLMMTKEISRIRHSMKKVLLVPLLPLLLLVYGLHTFSIKNLGHNTSNIELSADTLSVGSQLNVIKWKGPDGNYYTGSKRVYDNRTGILVHETIYENGKEIEKRFYNPLGQTGLRAISSFDGDIPITRHHFFQDHLFSKEILPHPDNDYIGTNAWYDDQGKLEYQVSYKFRSENYHGLETSYDEHGNILKQKRYENGELVETIK